MSACATCGCLLHLSRPSSVSAGDRRGSSGQSEAYAPARCSLTPRLLSSYNPRSHGGTRHAALLPSDGARRTDGNREPLVGGDSHNIPELHPIAVIRLRGWLGLTRLACCVRQLCVSENSPFPAASCGFLVAVRLRARVQIITLFGVYSCSLRALQRYRSSSPQWGHLSAVS
jgi:hypothetical protein